MSVLCLFSRSLSSRFHSSSFGTAVDSVLYQSKSSMPYALELDAFPVPIPGNAHSSACFLLWKLSFLFWTSLTEKGQFPILCPRAFSLSAISYLPYYSFSRNKVIVLLLLLVFYYLSKTRRATILVLYSYCWRTVGENDFFVSFS